MFSNVFSMGKSAEILKVLLFLIFFPSFPSSFNGFNDFEALGVIKFNIRFYLVLSDSKLSYAINECPVCNLGKQEFLDALL